MPTEFALPAVGENIDSAGIGNLLVKEGDVITAGQVVAEIETEKAVFELPCPHAGKITRIHVKPGDNVRVGAPLFTIEEGLTKETPHKEPPTPDSSHEPRSSSLAVSLAAPTEVPARESKSDAAKPQATRDTPSSTAAPTRGDGEALPPAPAGPATRRLARELGVDLHLVKGSGPGGRITPEDVQAHVRELTAGTSPPAAPPLPDFTQFGPVERKKLNKIQQTAAAHLSHAWAAIPHVTQHELADVTELEAGRKSFANIHAKDPSAPKITMTVLAMKAVVSALQAFPQFNASYDAATHEVIYKRYYNIGIAVDTDQGLLVPVIRHADTKTVLALAAELTELATKARARKLTLADFQGGTFTITNLGGIGGTAFTPIINHPEVAILGMSRTTKQQVIINDKPELRLLLPLSLSYDHRVINGADAARFIVKVAGLLSDPFHLLSEI